MSNLKGKLINCFNRNKLVVQKHSPEILAAVGVIGVVGTVATAIKATPKALEVLEGTKETLDKIKEVSENPEYADKYTEEDHKKDVATTYIQTAVKMTKVYGPTVVLGVASVGCLLSSNHILRKRNAALSAAYVTIDKSFKEYRDRVAERFGKEVEKEIRYNIKAEEVTTVDENGDEVKETVKTMATDPTEYSDYARFFDESCAAWHSDPEYNLMFLRSQQQYANDLLKSRGRLFLNEVYDMLGIDRTKAGQVVGWVYNPKDENAEGDNFVDFGIYDMSKERVRAFVNGYEANILLDFNVDGEIWSQM